jgi:chemotaxis protein CheD
MPDPGIGIVVGVADMAIGRESNGHLLTYALGSCIGLTVYDPVAKVGGLLHFMLPQPGEQTGAKDIKPSMYATTGVPLLFRKVSEAGARKERLIVCCAGGAEIIHDAGVFAIGKRNRTMLRKILWKDGTAVAAEDTGGSIPRTMSLNLTTGEVRIKDRDREGPLWAPGMKIMAVPRGEKP